jgi:quercetin dioxygenase-like cupin family protein
MLDTSSSGLVAYLRTGTEGKEKRISHTMTPTRIKLSLRIAGLTAVLAAVAIAAVPAQKPVLHVASGQRDILLQTTASWNGKPYNHYPSGQPQLTMIRLTIAPHTALPWHTHPYPNVVYVLSGSLTLHDQASGKTQVVHEGQAVGESVDAIHRGESGDTPTVLLITYAGTPGTPTSIHAKGEKAEY